MRFGTLAAGLRYHRRWRVMSTVPLLLEMSYFALGVETRMATSPELESLAYCECVGLGYTQL